MSLAERLERVRLRELSRQMAALHPDRVGEDPPDNDPPPSVDAIVDYINEIHNQAQKLDADITAALKAQTLNSPTWWLAEWRQFAGWYGQTVDTTTRNGSMPPIDWNGFVTDYNRRAYILGKESFVWRRAKQYEERLIALHDEFVQYGGKPTNPRPKPGYDVPPEKRPKGLLGGLGGVGETLESAAKLGLVVGGLWLLFQLRR